jgi:delta(3,5)-delta(2,4)-dienoyl-CoA isomerase
MEILSSNDSFDSKEALEQGFVSKVVDDHKAVLAAALATATLIAEKSPVAAIGTKHILNYSRDHTVQEGLDYVATWNQVMLTTPVSSWICVWN